MLRLVLNLYPPNIHLPSNWDYRCETWYPTLPCLLGRYSTTWAPLPAHFYVGYFWYRVSWTICSYWLWTMIFLISASRVAKMTGVSHWYLAYIFFFFCICVCSFSLIANEPYKCFESVLFMFIFLLPSIVLEMLRVNNSQSFSVLNTILNIEIFDGTFEHIKNSKEHYIT
jgi:hypothetical protein